MNDRTPSNAHTARHVILAGASGLVGGHLLDGLIADPSVASVLVLARRQLAIAAPKVRQVQVDFSRLPALPAADEVYLALGTTIKVAGSQPAFRAVDFDANLAVAQAAHAAGARRCGLVSAMGADAGSRIFYNRVKGELEQALSAMPFDSLVVVRPSLLLGDRDALGQPGRQGERMGELADRWLGKVIPANYRAIRAERVAQGLLARVPVATGRHIVLSGSI